MPTDAMTQFQPSVTKIATFSGAALPFNGGTPRRGMKCRVIYSAASNASGANAVQFAIDVSYDNSTWNPAEFQSDVINLTTVAQAGELYIPYILTPRAAVAGFNTVWARLTINITGAGSTPTCTYVGDNMLAGPM